MSSIAAPIKPRFLRKSVILSLFSFVVVFSAECLSHGLSLTIKIKATAAVRKRPPVHFLFNIRSNPLSRKSDPSARIR